MRGWKGTEDWCASWLAMTGMDMLAGSSLAYFLFSLLRTMLMPKMAFAAGIFPDFLARGFLSREPFGRPALHGRCCTSRVTISWF
jgi:hypothetical protein